MCLGDSSQDEGTCAMGISSLCGAVVRHPSPNHIVQLAGVDNGARVTSSLVSYSWPGWTTVLVSHPVSSRIVGRGGERCSFHIQSLCRLVAPSTQSRSVASVTSRPITSHHVSHVTFSHVVSHQSRPITLRPVTPRSVTLSHHIQSHHI